MRTKELKSKSGSGNNQEMELISFTYLLFKRVQQKDCDGIACVHARACAGTSSSQDSALEELDDHKM